MLVRRHLANSGARVVRTRAQAGVGPTRITSGRETQAIQAWRRAVQSSAVVPGKKRLVRGSARQSCRSSARQRRQGPERAATMAGQKG